jgi:ubiquinone/menaquinone biosynthesis C-methylase UbiE
MSFLHYFSRDAELRAKFIFNLIAPIYRKVDKYLNNSFDDAINKLDKEINIKDKSVLDIGTGTGAWIIKFGEKGAVNLTGIDFSKNMLKQSKKKNLNINFILGDGENLHQFADNSFDIVTASFVLHGVNKQIREKILNEMLRVSSRFVVFQDFYGKTPFFLSIIEFLERSDYKNFRKNFKSELKEKTVNQKIINLNYGTALYIAEKK